MELKSVMERIEESLERRLANLAIANFSSKNGLEVHREGIHLELKELEIQIANLKSKSILENDERTLEIANHWSHRVDQLRSRSHQALLEAKKKLGRRQLLLGKNKPVELSTQLDLELKDRFQKVEKNLAGAVERSEAANLKLQGGTRGMERVGQKYSEFGKTVEASRRLIRQYAKREEQEWFYFKAAIAFFLLVCGFIFYKRLPLLQMFVFPIIRSVFRRFSFSRTNVARIDDDAAGHRGARDP